MDTQIILSIVMAIATVTYTVITLMMWSESRKTRLQKIEPYIIAFLKPTEDHNTLTVIFKNIGEGCAKNVSVKVLQDYNQFDDKKLPLSDVSFIKNGATIMPPDYKYLYYIGSIRDIFSKHYNDFVEFEISYYDIRNKSYKEKFKLFFNEIGNNYSNPPETYMGQIPYYLNEIKQELKAIRTNNK